MKIFSLSAESRASSFTMALLAETFSYFRQNARTVITVLDHMAVKFADEF